MNLMQRINEVRKQIDYIKKDKSVSTGNSGSYKAVTHDQVTAMVRGHMVTNGIVSYPVLVSCESLPKEVNSQMEMAKQFRYEAVYDFVFANMDEPRDSITIRISAHAMDNADKAPGKALSYAKKYALLKLFEIETGEDEESRYQPEGMSDDRIEMWSVKIAGASDDETKKTLYKQAMDECKRLGDVDAANRIKSAVAPKAE